MKKLIAIASVAAAVTSCRSISSDTGARCADRMSPSFAASTAPREVAQREVGLSEATPTRSHGPSDASGTFDSQFATLPDADVSARAAASNSDAWNDDATTALFQELASTQGPTIGGWIRSRYANSSDVDVDALSAGDQELGGFSMDSIRLNVGGQAAPGFGFNVSLEGGNQGLLDTGNAGLTVLDAYATVALGSHAQVVIGRFGANFLWSANIEERKLMFLDRNVAAENTDGRDQGLEFQGWIERFNWWAALQNGSDGAGDELALSGRASYRLIGAQPCCLQEGCCESVEDDTQLVVGVAYLDDSNFDDGTALAGDVWFVHAPFSAYAEFVDWGDDIRPLAGIDVVSGTLIPVGVGAVGSQTSTSVTVGYMLSPARWEIAARVQDLDDGADTSVWSAALNHYVEMHNAKWTLQFDSSNSDNSALEADTFSIGLTAGI